MSAHSPTNVSSRTHGCQIGAVLRKLGCSMAKRALRSACLTGVAAVHAGTNAAGTESGVAALIGWTLATLGLSWILSIVWWILRFAHDPADGNDKSSRQPDPVGANPSIFNS